MASRACDQRRPRSAARWAVGLGAIVLLLIGVGAGLYFRNAGAALATLQRNYDQASNARQTALIAKDYDEAIRHADLALGLKATDPVASQLKAETQD